MSAATWVGVALLGGVGALARFALDGVVSERFPRDFPWGTLAVNLLGAAVLGLLAGLALKGDALVLAGTATLGAFTTFSTWVFESNRLAEDGRGSVALLNLGGSLVVGFGAVTLGHLIGAAL